MGLIGMIEEAVRFDESLLCIRKYDAAAPEEPELRRRIKRIAARTGGTRAGIAARVASEMIKSGERAEVVIAKMEEQDGMD